MLQQKVVQYALVSGLAEWVVQVLGQSWTGVVTIRGAFWGASYPSFKLWEPDLEITVVGWLVELDRKFFGR